MSRNGFINTVLILILFIFIIIAGSCTSKKAPTQIVEPNVDWYTYFSLVVIPEQESNAIVGYSAQDAAGKDSLIFPNSMSIGDFQFFGNGQKVVINYWDMAEGWSQSIQVRDVVTGDTLAIQPSNMYAIGKSGLIVSPDEQHAVVFNSREGYEYYSLSSLSSKWLDSTDIQFDIAFLGNEKLVQTRSGSRDLHLSDMSNVGNGQDPIYTVVTTDVFPELLAVDHVRGLLYLIAEDTLGTVAYLDKLNLKTLTLVDRMQLPDNSGFSRPVLNPSSGNLFISYSCESTIDQQIIEINTNSMTSSILLDNVALVESEFSPTDGAVTFDGKKLFIMSRSTCSGSFPQTDLVVIDIENKSIDTVLYNNGGGSANRVHVRPTPIEIVE